MSMGGAMVPGMSPRRLFYANPNNGTLVSFFQSNTTAPIFSPNHDRGWGFVEGGIAATAFGYQTRVYYFDNGDLSVAAQNGSTWAPTQKV